LRDLEDEGHFGMGTSLAAQSRPPTVRACAAVPITEPTTHILSEQGAEINRPSTLYVEVDHAGGEISAVRVGGQVVLVAEGFGTRSLLNSLSTKLGEGKY